MKLLLPIFAALTVWISPIIGQPNPNPPTSGNSPVNPPTVALAGNPPPDSRNRAVDLPQRNRPRPPARVGVFTPSGNNQWPAAPTRQQPRNPFLQAMQMSLMTDMDAVMDIVERPCGSSLNFGMLQSAFDFPDSHCECRVGQCGSDALPDFSLTARRHCLSFATCCCFGYPHANLAASMMQNSLLGARSPGRSQNRIGGNTHSGVHGGGPNYPHFWLRR